MSDLVLKNNFILYNAPSGDVTLNVLLQNETAEKWLGIEEWNRIKKETGMEGGLRHTYNE